MYQQYPFFPTLRIYVKELNVYQSIVCFVFPILPFLWILLKVHFDFDKYRLPQHDEDDPRWFEVDLGLLRGFHDLFNSVHQIRLMLW